MLRRLQARTRDERGATIVLFSFLLVSLLGISSLVLDFGLIRFDRQRNKSAADTAAAAGMRSLEIPRTGVPSSFRGACAALDFLRANHPDLPSLTGTWKYADGMPLGFDPCHPTNPASVAIRRLACLPSVVSGYERTWAVFEGDPVNKVDVEIRSGYDVNDTSGGTYQDETFHDDDGSPEQGGCDHLAVIITESERPGFGAVFTSGDLTTRVRSVARASFGTRTDAIIALLLLERHDCISLDVDGNSGAFIEVLGTGPRQGIIHSDSGGDGDDCNEQNKILNVNPAGPVVWPPDAGITARQSETGATPGRLSVYALSGMPGTEPGEAADPWPYSVYAEGQPGTPPGGPVGGDLLGRGSIDRRYLEQMRDLRQEAATKTAWILPEQAEAAGYTPVGCPNAGTITAQKVFVDCTDDPGSNPSGSGFAPNSAVTFTAPDAEIVINHKVTVTGGNARIVIQDPKSVFVRGSGGTGISVGTADGLEVNRSTYSNCKSRQAADAAGKVEFVVMNGSFSATGNGGVSLCQTMLYLAGGIGLPLGVGDAPYENASTGTLTVNGGGGLDWTAPNQLPNTPTLTQLNSDQYRFEDLALWTEASDDTDIGGGGAITMEGVFFLPNADVFKISGNGNQNIGENAQFIVRKLKVSGNSFLRMKPNANDAIAFPFFAGSALVR